MSIPLRVLVLEDQITDAELMVYELRQAGFDPAWTRVESEQDYIAHLDPSLDLILADYLLPQFDALRALQILQEQGLDIPFIVVTGSISEEAAVECMRRGASDYLLKDRLTRLGPAVTHALEEKKLRQEKLRSERFLRALNTAALEMERALTPEQVFAAAGRELERMGLSCAIWVVDEKEGKVDIEYCNSRSDALREAAEVAGLSLDSLSALVDRVDVFKAAFESQEAVFAQDASEILRAMIVDMPDERVQQVMGLLEGLKSIYAPLTAADRGIGLLSVYSRDLVEADVPTVTAFANQIAAAWHKAQLMRDLEESMEELKRTQDQLLHAQKMEAVGRLAGGLAHDFNNILTTIIGYSEFLAASLNKNDPRWADVQEIKSAAERAASLTRQLLAFSRRQVMRPQILDLNALIDDLEKMLRRLIGEDIELVTALEPGLWAVRADPSQIEQVLLNLVINSRDAMPSGGELTIETGNRWIDAEYAGRHLEVEPGPYVMLAVSDTGVGMSEEVQAHVFEPFFTTKENGKGTGLGLATVYGIIKQSGGHIWFYSEPGIGTTFKIYLPRVEEKARPLERKRPPVEMPRGTETVLVVEDEDIVRSLACRILAQHGYTVLEAGRPEQALQIGLEHDGPIHLLVTDVVMPGMGGRDMADRLMAVRPEMKVLYVSGYTNNTIAHHGILEPGVAFLQKPFTPATLLHRVRQVLDRPADRSERAADN